MLIGNCFWEAGFPTILISFLMAFCLAFYQFSSVKIYPFSNQTQNVFYFKGEKELKTELMRPWKLAGGRGWRRRSSGDHRSAGALFVLWNLCLWHFKWPCSWGFLGETWKETCPENAHRRP